VRAFRQDEATREEAEAVAYLRDSGRDLVESFRETAFGKAAWILEGIICGPLSTINGTFPERRFAKVTLPVAAQGRFTSTTCAFLVSSFSIHPPDAHHPGLR
jgi:hypothetical protein